MSSVLQTRDHMVNALFEAITAAPELISVDELRRRLSELWDEGEKIGMEWQSMQGFAAPDRTVENRGNPLQNEAVNTADLELLQGIVDSSQPGLNPIGVNSVAFYLLGYARATKDALLSHERPKDGS